MDSNLALPVGTTLDRFIQKNERSFLYATGELSQLLRDLALAAKITNRDINRAGLTGMSGTVGIVNVQGEQQMKLDAAADIRFIRALTNGGEVCAIVSEEDETVVYADIENGKYIVSIDPLDGSSNIDINGALGTIFSIYRRTEPQGSPLKDSELLQKGSAQVAAGYILYGSSTMLVYTTGNGVNGFTYDPTLGEFYLSHPGLKLPNSGKIYSCNESQFHQFSDNDQNFLNYCKASGFTARYIGALVADFHRSMIKGGIYLYPGTKNKPEGKLRLNYECNALAFIAEQAGGMATDGQQNILDLQPRSLHQRVPLYIGSSALVSSWFTKKVMEEAAI